MDDKRRRDFGILIGEKGTSYYLSVFEKIENGWPLNPNIFAGIFGPLWMIRRKLVVGVVLFYLPMVVLSYLVLHAFYTSFKDLSQHWPLIFVLPHLALFLAGNNVYYLRCRRMMLRQDVVDSGFGDSQRVVDLMWRGGTMPGLPFLVYSAILGKILFSFIFWFVLSPYYFSVVSGWLDPFLISLKVK
ncbi:MAG: hypothetical protein GC134_03720 [Proteobacteria bacterium]|nr:hypothetical protein [Pseudomonadota bacterium]